MLPRLGQISLFITMNVVLAHSSIRLGSIAPESNSTGLIFSQWYIEEPVAVITAEDSTMVVAKHLGDRLDKHHVLTDALFLHLDGKKGRLEHAWMLLAAEADLHIYHAVLEPGGANLLFVGGAQAWVSTREQLVGCIDTASGKLKWVRQVQGAPWVTLLAAGTAGGGHGPVLVGFEDTDLMLAGLDMTADGTTDRAVGWAARVHGWDWHRNVAAVLSADGSSVQVLTQTFRSNGMCLYSLRVGSGDAEWSLALTPRQSSKRQTLAYNPQGLFRLPDGGLALVGKRLVLLHGKPWFGPQQAFAARVSPSGTLLWAAGVGRQAGFVLSATAAAMVSSARRLLVLGDERRLVNGRDYRYDLMLYALNPSTGALLAAYRLGQGLAVGMATRESTGEVIATAKMQGRFWDVLVWRHHHREEEEGDSGTPECASPDVDLLYMGPVLGVNLTSEVQSQQVGSEVHTSALNVSLVEVNASISVADDTSKTREDAAQCLVDARTTTTPITSTTESATATGTSSGMATATNTDTSTGSPTTTKSSSATTTGSSSTTTMTKASVSSSSTSSISSSSSSSSSGGSGSGSGSGSSSISVTETNVSSHWVAGTTGSSGFSVTGTSTRTTATPAAMTSASVPLHVGLHMALYWTLAGSFSTASGLLDSLL